MARAEPTCIAVTEWREDPPPPPFRPDPRPPALLWVFSVARIVAATLVFVVATVFVEPYLIGGLRLPAMRRRPGAQPMVVETPVARPHHAHVDRSLRVIRRPRVWTLFVMALIVLSIPRGPTPAGPSVDVPLLAAHAPVNGLVEISLGHSAASNAEAPSCAIVFGMNVAIVQQSYKAN